MKKHYLLNQMLSDINDDEYRLQPEIGFISRKRYKLNELQSFINDYDMEANSLRDLFKMFKESYSSVGEPDEEYESNEPE